MLQSTLKLIIKVVSELPITKIYYTIIKHVYLYFLSMLRNLKKNVHMTKFKTLEYIANYSVKKNCFFVNSIGFFVPRNYETLLFCMNQNKRPKI